MQTDLMAKLSAGIALAGAVSLVIFMFGGTISFSPPSPLLMLQAIMVPIVVIGVGLGGIALMRGSEDRRALIGVLGGGAYLFLLSTLLALAVAG